ncbi:hypothetical protein BDZ94DRAFT_1275396 [Collybia nuda]|uniref:Neuroguidin n=1 Tax=Collybia nuda TaxID=64659 RepID=A0A9P6C8Y3_9AGAR|nr:hypothetical protein BDZ94DRAFT_1275396 [Collybia nuda]
MDIEHSDSQHFCDLLEEMTNSIISTRGVVASLRQSQNLDTKEGISLLSLKHHVVLSYLHFLVLLSTRRTLGDPLDVRSPSLEAFSTQNRTPRGSYLGDVVDHLIEGRIILEKSKLLETRMRYQIEKLIRVADEPGEALGVIDDPLTFRPNLADLHVGESESSGNKETYQSRTNIKSNHAAKNEIYMPPRVAPMPYREKWSRTKKDGPPIPSALGSLSDPSQPHKESTSGLGATSSLASGRAVYLKRLTAFEEDNFSRVVMKKSDARRRARDEEDLALGSSLGGGGQSRRLAGGLEDEFGDVLKGIERVSSGRGRGPEGDGYDELRNEGRKAGFLERSRKNDNMKRSSPGILNGGEVEVRAKKRTRFELETKMVKKKLNRGNPF